MNLYNFFKIIYIDKQVTFINIVQYRLFQSSFMVIPGH